MGAKLNSVDRDTGARNGDHDFAKALQHSSLNYQVRFACHVLVPTKKNADGYCFSRRQPSAIGYGRTTPMLDTLSIEPALAYPSSYFSSRVVLVRPWRNNNASNMLAFC